jgi:hypothetical protein
MLRSVPEWVYFLHAPREDFAATITEEERGVWREHFARLQLLLDDGYARGELRPFRVSLLRPAPTPTPVSDLS